RLFANAAASATQNVSDRFVLIRTNSTKTNPLINQPIKSISQTYIHTSTYSYPSDPTQIINSIPTIPSTICPSIMKQRPPIILISSTPLSRTSASRNQLTNTSL